MTEINGMLMAFSFSLGDWRDQAGTRRASCPDTREAVPAEDIRGDKNAPPIALSALIEWACSHHCAFEVNRL